MVRREHASNARVYRDATLFLDKVIDTVPNFPREFKHTVGARMQELAVEQLLAISEAYHATDRRSREEALARTMRVHDVLRTLLRVASERRWIRGTGRCAEMMEIADGIERQSSAWRRSVAKGSEGADTVPERGGQGRAGEPAATP